MDIAERYVKGGDRTVLQGLGTSGAAKIKVNRAIKKVMDRENISPEEMSQRVDLSSSIESCIRDGLAANRFYLHYQPVVDVATGKMVGAEALLRLPNEHGDAIGPARFISVAESSGMIAPLGDWIATEICRQQRAWAGEGLPPLPVAYAPPPVAGPLVTPPPSP